MRRKSCPLFVSALLALAAATAASAPSAYGQTMRPVMRPPDDTRPRAEAAHSTAQGGSRHNLPPLQALPAFSATDLNARPVAVAGLAKPGRWLMLYVRMGCDSCTQELRALANSTSPGVQKGAPYVILLGKGGGPNALDTLKARYPGLADATWLEDRDGSAAAALKPAGAPILYGLAGTNITFVLPGSLGDTANAERMAGAWLTEKPNDLQIAAAKASLAPGAPGPLLTPGSTGPAAAPAGSGTKQPATK